MIKPWLERPHPAFSEGTQKLYKFSNGYGASVVQNPYSYGGKDGLWELAVLKFEGKHFNLTYDTPLSKDVIGWLTPRKAENLLKKIQALPGKEG